jgi:TonB-linked SusC/RagA family outer membrane protein
MKKIRDYYGGIFGFLSKKTVRAMKLTFFLSMVTIVQLLATESYSQMTKLSLKLDDVKIADALKEIENQSEFYFLYSPKLIDVERKVNIDAEKEPIRDILSNIFDENVKFTVYDRQIILTRSDLPVSSAELQQQKITGTVTDEKGNPMPGVTVQVKGTSNGILTDMFGKYTFTNLSQDAILVFSFVGMSTQEIVTKGQMQINVVLKEMAIGLDEVVVTGYSTQRVKDLTGSVVAVKGEALTKAPVPSLNNALAGKMTGVISIQNTGTPGNEEGRFYIRGQSTFGDNSALVLVDGVEREYSRIDPNDIESVTILKDAASAAIYGSRAANGVILITTKRGTQKGVHITYTGSYGVQKPTYLPAMMNSYQYATGINEAFSNQASLQGGVYTPMYTDAEIAAYKNGTGTYTNWWKETMNPSSITQQHNITLNGGTDNIKALVSVGTSNQGGLYSLSWFKKDMLRANIDAELTKDLTISVNIAGRQEERNESSSSQWSVFQLFQASLPNFEPYVYIDPTGKVTTKNDPTGHRELAWNGLNYSPIGNVLNSGFNNIKNQVSENSAILKYKVPFINGLVSRLAYSYDRSFINTKNFNTPYNFYVNGTLNSNGSTIKLNQDASNNRSQTLQFTLDYSKTLGKHTFGALFVFEKSDSYYEYFSAYREGFTSAAIPQLFAGGSLNKTNNGLASIGARMGYVGRINYNYEDKYLVQVNGRYDGSFNFSSDRRWGFFPAASVAWRVSKESFLQGVSWLENLKLRASIGQYGNDRIAQYMYQQGYVFTTTDRPVYGTITGSSPVFNVPIAPTALANVNVTWETATSKNIGFDWGILKGQITGEFDLFKKRTKNILMLPSASVPDSFGADVPMQNIGVVDNWGFEAAARFNTKVGSIIISFEPNITYATSRVIAMAEASNVPPGLRQTGRPFGERYGFVSEGLYQTTDFNDDGTLKSGIVSQYTVQAGDIKYKDISGPNGVPDKVIDYHDRTDIGSSRIPKYIYGLNLGLQYKNFDLTANLQGAFGYEAYRWFNAFDLTSNAMAAVVDSWRPGNENARFPRTYIGQSDNNKQVSSYWLVNGAYLKLRNIELAYTVPKLRAMTKIGISNLRLSLSANNLFSLSKMKEYDPEAPDMDSTTGHYYFQMKTVMGGIQVEF